MIYRTWMSVFHSNHTLRYPIYDHNYPIAHQKMAQKHTMMQNQWQIIDLILHQSTDEWILKQLKHFPTKVNCFDSDVINWENLTQLPVQLSINNFNPGVVGARNMVFSPYISVFKDEVLITVSSVVTSFIPDLVPSNISYTVYNIFYCYLWNEFEYFW